MESPLSLATYRGCDRRYYFTMTGTRIDFVFSCYFYDILLIRSGSIKSERPESAICNHEGQTTLHRTGIIKFPHHHSSDCFHWCQLFVLGFSLDLVVCPTTTTFHLNYTLISTLSYGTLRRSPDTCAIYISVSVLNDHDIVSCSTPQIPVGLVRLDNSRCQPIS